MTRPVYPAATTQIVEHRKQLAPETHDAFEAFTRQVFADGALDQGRAAQGRQRTRADGSDWVAAEMRAGGAFAHSALTLETAGHAPGPRAA